MAINFDTTRTYLQKFDFARLFIEILGWSNVETSEVSEISEV